MIIGLEIHKDEGADQIIILPQFNGDNERVIDIMQYLCLEYKDESTRKEFEHSFSLEEVEMIRDFLTSVLNIHYRITKK